MSTSTVQATLAHPARDERSVVLDLIVDTGATYTLLPAEVVAQLGLATPYQRPVVLASGERVTYRVGQVRLKLADEEWTTTFFAGPTGCHALLGAVTLEQFGLAADPVHRRLVPVPGLLLHTA